MKHTGNSGWSGWYRLNPDGTMKEEDRIDTLLSEFGLGRIIPTFKGHTYNYYGDGYRHPYHITLIANPKTTFCQYDANNYIVYNQYESFKQFMKNNDFSVEMCETCVSRYYVEDFDNFSGELQMKLLRTL